MENSKMTYAYALDVAIESVTDAEVAEKLTTLKEQLARRQTSRKPRVNTAKIELAEKAYDIMEKGIPYRVSELAQMLAVSSQKLAPAMKILVEEGKVAKEIEKRVVYYTAQES